MLGIIIIMAALVLAEAAFIFFFVTQATAIVADYEAKLTDMEFGVMEEEKAVAICKTAASVKKVWEGDV